MRKAGLNISQLDDMKARVEKYFTTYKEPTFDEDGKLKYIKPYIGKSSRNKNNNK
jgi:hypothetical protein